MMPTTKVTAGVLAGALTTVAMYFWKKYGGDVTVEIQGAIMVLITFAVQYVVPDKE